MVLPCQPVAVILMPPPHTYTLLYRTWRKNCFPRLTILVCSPMVVGDISDSGIVKGRVPITWSFVACPDSLVSGPVQYLFEDGSTVDWLAVQVRNHKRAIQSLEMNGKALQRSASNQFIGTGVGPGPYTITITSTTGETITDSGLEIASGAQSGQSQFN